MRRTAVGLAGVALMVVSAGCAAEGKVPAAKPPAELQLVVIGDSIADPSEVCPGCTGWMDQYATDLGASTGRPVTATRLDAAGVPDAQQLVASDENARALLELADVVVLEVGYNNVLPDPETGIGCLGSLGDGSPLGILAWIRTTEPGCLADGLETYRLLYDDVFTTLSELRDGEPTLFVALNVYDGNIGGPGSLVGLMPRKVRQEVMEWTVASYERWNPMLCETATAQGFACVDIYHAFNGPAADQLAGDLTVDGTHPSQNGNDTIASLLADVDTSSLTG